MKLSKLAKTLPIVLGLGICANANAGVSATAYLELNDLFVEIDTDGNGVGDVAPGDIGSFIRIDGGTRDGQTSSNFNGVLDGDAVSGPATAVADANLACSGPSCAGLGLVNNGQSLDGALDLPVAKADLVYSDAFDFAASDMQVSGNAIGGGASGFTYGDVGISVPNSIGAASSAIFNNLITFLTIDVATDIDLRFTALYDLLVDAIISADIAADNNLVATANASANFEIKITPTTGTVNGILTPVSSGIQGQDIATDFPGLGDLTTVMVNDGAFASDWYTLTRGQYTVGISQNVVAQASLIPEPGAIALFGMGLLGLGLSARRKLIK